MLGSWLLDPRNDQLRGFQRVRVVDALSHLVEVALGILTLVFQTYPFFEDAVRDLAELDSLEIDIYEATESRALPDGAVQIDYSIVDDHVREAYDLIEWKGYVYVFNK